METEGECPAGENDELHLVYALYDSVELTVHHDAGHLEVEVEKSDQKGYYGQQIESHVHRVHHLVTEHICIEHYHGN